MRKQRRKSRAPGAPESKPARSHSPGRGAVREPINHYRKMTQSYFVTGALVWVPLIVTLWVSWWVVKNIGLGFESGIRHSVPLIQALGRHVPALAFLEHVRYIPGAGFALVVALFVITGYFARSLVTQKVIQYGEQLVRKIPLISRIYTAVQQIRDVFINRNGAVFNQVALIEYPRPGVFVVAFETAKARGAIVEATKQELVAVFVPTTPNPTSGFLLYLPQEQVMPLNMSVEDAMKLIISGGAYMDVCIPERQETL